VPYAAASRGTREHADVGIVVEEAINAGPQEGDLLVDGPTVRGGIGADSKRRSSDRA
jgi:hypothetical protein